MPKLPFYDRTVKSEALNPATVRAPGPSGLDALGAGIAKAGSVVTDIADKEIRRAEDTQINNFEVEFSNAEAKIREQVGSLKGEAAFLPQIGPDGTPTGATPDETARARLDAARTELLDRLVPSSRAKEMALERSKRTVASAHQAIDSHVTTQREVAFRASDDAARQAREDRMGRDALIESERNGILMDSDLRAGALARSPEEAQAMQAEARQRLHGIALDRMLDPVVGDPKSAATYFNEIKGELGTKTTYYESRVKTVKTEADDTEMAATAIHATRWPLGSDDPKRAVDEEYGTPWLNQQRVSEALQSEDLTPGAKTKMLQAAAASAKGQAEERAAYFGKVNLDRISNGGVIKPEPEWEYMKLHDREGAAKILAASEAAKEALARSTRARGTGDKAGLRAAAEAQKAANKQALDEFRGLAPEEQAALDSDEKLATWATEQGISIDAPGLSALKPERRQGIGQNDAADNTRNADFVDAYTEKVPGFAALKPAQRRKHQADARRLYAKNGGKELPLVKFDDVIVKAFLVKKKGPSLLSYHPFALAAGAASSLYDKAAAPPPAPAISDEERSSAARALPGRTPAEIEAIILANRKANGQ